MSISFVDCILWGNLILFSISCWKSGHLIFWKRGVKVEEEILKEKDKVIRTGKWSESNSGSTFCIIGKGKFCVRIISRISGIILLLYE